MPNKVFTTPIFETKFKRLSKKFSSIGDELDALEEELKENPKLGTQISGNIYKVRLASSDKGKGKSGGFRIITYLLEEDKRSTEIYLVTIYDKSEESSIKKAELVKLIKSIFQ
jgi:mRNA-degrading endonuclease RelE of RelBE toxin-antitoxin system